MNLDGRLGRLYPTLTAKERFVMVLRAYREERPQDIAVVRSTPEHQRREYNRYIALLSACNRDLGFYVLLLKEAAATLAARTGLAWAAASLPACVEGLARLVPAKQRAKAEKALRLSVLPVDLPWRPEPAGPTWAELAEELLEDVREEADSLWREVRAVEVVLEELSGEFEGEDLAKPGLREEIAGLKEAVLGARRLLYGEPPEAPEAGQRELDGVRELISITSGYYAGF